MMTTQEAQDLLSTAVEGGGCYYWAVSRNLAPDRSSVEIREESKRDAWIPVKAEDLITSAEEAKRLYPHWTKAIDDPLMHDAEVADVVMQVAMFGKIIYG